MTIYRGRVGKHGHISRGMRRTIMVAIAWTNQNTSRDEQISGTRFLHVKLAASSRRFANIP